MANVTSIDVGYSPKLDSAAGRKKKSLVCCPDQVRRSSKSVGANIAEGAGVFIIWIMSDFAIWHVVLWMRH
ncbi:MAG: four helix bundle protein [Anaerolineales bacterium]|nr:four helix bundle protein [Anaerolineales bacterium]